MDLLIIKEKVDGFQRKYEYRYELWKDRKNSLCRKMQLNWIESIVSIEIIPIELEKDMIYEDI